jgi:hypothetical protein
MTSTLRVSNAKAKADLGWEPTIPTYRDGIRRIADTLTAPSPATPMIARRHKVPRTPMPHHNHEVRLTR